MYHGKRVVFITAVSARAVHVLYVRIPPRLLPTAAVWYFEVGVIFAIMEQGKLPGELCGSLRI